MGKIATYTSGTPTLATKLLGTNVANSDETENFTAASVLALKENYGNWFSLVTQSSTADTIKVVACEEVGISQGVTLTQDGDSLYSKINFDNSGTYNINLSAQLYRTSSGGNKNVAFWLRKNGTDVANSAQIVTLGNAPSYLNPSVNFQVEVLNTDYLQVMWTHEDVITLATVAANGSIPYPAVPSVKLNVTQVA